MTDTWDRTLFDKDLKAILDSKLPVSASKITSLSSLATAHPQHHNYIIHCITRFIEKAPADYRLAGLYVIDAISRSVHKQQRKREENNEGPHELDGYLKRFAIVLKDDALNGCFEPCSAKDKDKVKKTLDFWEQGSVYSKDVVQYVKCSFLNSQALTSTNMDKQQEKGIPAVDTAQLLATLSNIGNGTLANLNIPGLNPIPAESTTAVAAPPQQQPDILPPALAKLLGGLVSSPSSNVVPPPSPSSDPRVRNDPRVPSDPRQRNTTINNNNNNNSNSWPPPQGPSIPAPTRTTERKSRWGSANDTTAANTVTSPPRQQSLTQQDSWQQRQIVQDSRMGSYQSPRQGYQTQQPLYQQQSYQQQQPSYQNHQPFQQQQQASYHQPSPSYQTYQQQPQYNNNIAPQQQSGQKGAEPASDASLPPGCIRVLTRTLFVGPIPDHFEKNDVAQLFSKYGELASIIVSKKFKGKHNAFLKYTTRASTEAAKYESAGMIVEGIPVKVNWAFGFGPKKHFNYDRGDSIIPLSELSAEEKDNLMVAPVGGFQGQPVRPMMVIEEPEAQYRPEWKNANEEQRGFKRQPPQSGANFEEINSNRKRGRFSAVNDDGYYNNNNNNMFFDAAAAATPMGGRGQGFYQQPQQYDSTIPYSDHH